MALQIFYFLPRVLETMMGILTKEKKDGRYFHMFKLGGNDIRLLKSDRPLHFLWGEYIKKLPDIQQYMYSKKKCVFLSVHGKYWICYCRYLG